MLSTLFSNRNIVGVIIVAVGVLLLLGTLDVLDAGELWRWFPSLFILMGIIALIRNRFRHLFGPLLLISVAAVVQIVILGGIAWGIVWPVALILLGVVIIFGRSRHRRPNRSNGETVASPQRSADSTLNATSICASTETYVDSSKFLGGELTAVMAEAKLDMRDAKIEIKPATVEVTCVMAEVEIRVPTDWSVRIDSVTTLAETTDKRSSAGESEGSPDLLITGTVVLGSLAVDD